MSYNRLSYAFFSLFLLFQLHEYVSLVDNTESQVQEAQEKLEATEKDMETMRKHHEEEKKKLQTNYKQISEQNSLLHKEIEKVILNCSCYINHRHGIVETFCDVIDSTMGHQLL